MAVAWVPPALRNGLRAVAPRAAVKRGMEPAGWAASSLPAESAKVPWAQAPRLGQVPAAPQWVPAPSLSPWRWFPDRSSALERMHGAAEPAHLIARLPADAARPPA